MRVLTPTVPVNAVRMAARIASRLDMGVLPA